MSLIPRASILSSVEGGSSNGLICRLLESNVSYAAYPCHTTGSRSVTAVLIVPAHEGKYVVGDTIGST